VIDVGFALIDTVGAGGGGPTVTATLWFAAPPVPVHTIEYVVLAVGDTDWVPEIALVPVQPLLAVHVVALVEDQVRVEDAPEVMVDGVAVIERVGV